MATLGRGQPVIFLGASQDCANPDGHMVPVGALGRVRAIFPVLDGHDVVVMLAEPIPGKSGPQPRPWTRARTAELKPLSDWGVQEDKHGQEPEPHSEDLEGTPSVPQEVGAGERAFASRHLSAQASPSHDRWRCDSAS